MFENGCFLRRQKRFKLPNRESSGTRRKKVQQFYFKPESTDAFHQDRTVKQERQQHSIVYDENALIKQEFKPNILAAQTSPNIDPSELARLSAGKSDELNGSPRIEVINRLQISINFFCI